MQRTVILANHTMKGITKLASLAAFLLIGFQIAAKATRDTLFLSNFDVSFLPIMLVGAALFSIVAIFVASGALAAFSPGVLVPALFLGSAGFLLLEWALLDRFPEAIAVGFYLHLAAFGAVLISAFWSIINELFDPRGAKKAVSSIGAGGALGGFTGGLLAERIGAVLQVSDILPVLASIHLVCAGLIYRIARPHFRRASEGGEKAGFSSNALDGIRKLSGLRYLQQIAVLVLFATVGATLIDYLFKAQAASVYQDSDSLMRFFAIFYTAVGLLAFLTQVLFTNFFLKKLGLGNTATVLFAALVGGSLGMILSPGITSTSLARAGEMVFRNSFFRSGYELLYTPVAAVHKRATKIIIDVGFDHLGDIVGSGLVMLFLFLAPTKAQVLMLSGAFVSGLAGMFVFRLLQKGYVLSLEQRLLEGVDTAAGLPGEAGPPDSVHTLNLSSALLPETTELHRATRPAAAKDLPTLAPANAEERQAAIVGPAGGLQSEEAESVRAFLHSIQRPPEELTPGLVDLLAWDEMAAEAASVLRRVSPAGEQLLLQSLLDPGQDFAVRRRIPRILSNRPSAEVVSALFEALRDERFEVRFQAALALSRIRRSGVELGRPPGEIFSIALAEVTVEKKVWESQRLLDEIQEEEDCDLVDDLLRRRVNRSLEHVFRILSLALPGEGIRLALMGLHTNDPMLRGVALEYLESVLPKLVRESLWPFLEAEPSPKGFQRSREEILDSLMRSHQSIAANLEGLRK
jgi:hypothetical protein